eukprot:jgi/Tetstr1/449212/TSEL_036419.t1
MVRWDDAPTDVKEPGQTLRREQATAGWSHPSIGGLCSTSSVHSQDCLERLLHYDETAIRHLKHARAGKGGTPQVRRPGFLP